MDPSLRWGDGGGGLRISHAGGIAVGAAVPVGLGASVGLSAHPME